MRTKKGNSLHIIVSILAIVSVTALAAAGAFGALYINEAGKVRQLEEENKQLMAQQTVPVLSLDVADGETAGVPETDGEDAADGETAGTQDGIFNEDAPNGDASGGESPDGGSSGAEPTSVEAFAQSPEQASQAGVSGLMQSKEDEIEQSIKDRMKELVTNEDGSPLKMLRSFFPENLIYYFEEEYVFAPVLDGVDKHTLLDENFTQTDDGQMQYVENGVVTSHKGIDVSKYQGDIDWASVKEDGVEYAFIRLGIRGYESGKLVLDEYYHANMKGANDAGVQAGIYYFTQAVTVEEAIEEANFVIENMAGYDVQCPIVFDVELIGGDKGRADKLTKEERTEITIAFCEAIRQAGYTPMIYGNVVCFTRLLDMTRLNQYEKWYAFYDDYMYMPYNVSCWQYSESGKVKGIGTKVDLNISYKTWRD